MEGEKFALCGEKQALEQEKTGIREELVKIEQEKMDLDTEKMGMNLKMLHVSLQLLFHKFKKYGSLSKLKKTNVSETLIYKVNVNIKNKLKCEVCFLWLQV